MDISSLLLYRLRTAKHRDDFINHGKCDDSATAGFFQKQLGHPLLYSFHHLCAALLSGIESIELVKIFLGGETCVVLQ